MIPNYDDYSEEELEKELEFYNNQINNAYKVINLCQHPTTFDMQIFLLKTRRDAILSALDKKRNNKTLKL